MNKIFHDQYIYVGNSSSHDQYTCRYITVKIQAEDFDRGFFVFGLGLTACLDYIDHGIANRECEYRLFVSALEDFGSYTDHGNLLTAY